MEKSSPSTSGLSRPLASFLSAARDSLGKDDRVGTPRLVAASPSFWLGGLVGWVDNPAIGTADEISNQAG